MEVKSQAHSGFRLLALCTGRCHGKEIYIFGFRNQLFTKGSSDFIKSLPLLRPPFP
jgi:hypothetical protein